MPHDDPHISLPDLPQNPKEYALERLAQLRPQLAANPPAQWPPALKEKLRALLDALEAADPSGPARLADELLEKNGQAPHSLAALRHYLSLAEAQEAQEVPGNRG